MASGTRSLLRSIGVFLLLLGALSACAPDPELGDPVESTGDGAEMTGTTALPGSASVSSLTTIPSEEPTQPVEMSSGCSAPAPTGGSGVGTVISGGATREYSSYVPSTYDHSRPTHLVILLHGLGMFAGSAMDSMGMTGAAEAKGFVVVSPQAANWPAPWNVTGDPSKLDDIAFVDHMINVAASRFCLDLGRVHLVGTDVGGFLATEVSCAYAERFDSIVVLGGVSIPASCHPEVPVPVRILHGTADPFVPYFGGIGDSMRLILGDIEVQLGAVEIPPVATGAEAWADRNGCEGGYVEAQETASVSVREFDCPADATVELFTMTGVGHTWPPGTVAQLGNPVLYGPATNEIDGTELIWDLFTADR